MGWPRKASAVGPLWTLHRLEYGFGLRDVDSPQLNEAGKRLMSRGGDQELAALSEAAFDLNQDEIARVRMLLYFDIGAT